MLQLIINCIASSWIDVLDEYFLKCSKLPLKKKLKVTEEEIKNQAAKCDAEQLLIYCTINNYNIVN